MTFLAPGFLWGAALVATATTLLHLLAWRRPPTVPLPTARFVPERTMRAMTRTVRLSDVALLLLRVTLIGCAGVALARPVLAARPTGSVRVILADLSRAVASREEVRERVRAHARDDDVVIAFDGRANTLPSVAAFDSLIAGGGDSEEAGALTAALVAVTRAAERLRATHDTVAVVLVSPLLAEELDAATLAVRAQWEGAITHVPVAARKPEEPGALAVRAEADDPVRVALTVVPVVPDESGESRRLVRGAPGAPDSAWLREGRDRLLVAWPADGAAADTAYGVLSAAGAYVGVMPRGAAAGATTPDADTRVVARWADGSPAAEERAVGGGCLRTVRVPVPGAGDQVLSAAFARLARDLVAPCGGAMDTTRAAATVVRALTTAPAPGPAASVTRTPADAERSRRLSAWLLAAALLLSLVELAVRRGAGRVSA
jgi:hypothetical protein